MKNNYKYHYFYEITNNLNGHFYYGIHSTNDLNDGYMGSGNKLRLAFKEFGIENFSKEILKFFESREELAKYEADVVNEELVRDERCYNLAIGGEFFCCLGSFVAFDKELNIWRRITDQEYNADNNRYLKSPGCGYINVYDKENDGVIVRITMDEYNNNKERYTVLNAYQKDHIIVSYKDNPNKQFLIDKKDFDENIYNRSKTEIKKGQVCVKDSNNKCFFVYKDDPRYISGELKLAFTGYKFTDEQKAKLKQIIKERGLSKGEKNSQWGTKWINKDGETKKVKKEELEKYLNSGWSLGMKKK